MLLYLKVNFYRVEDLAMEYLIVLKEFYFIKDFTNKINIKDGEKLQIIPANLEKENMMDMAFILEKIFIMKDFSSEENLAERGLVLKDKKC